MTTTDATRRTFYTYRCDHCGYETTVLSSMHRPMVCDRTACSGTRSPIADEDDVDAERAYWSSEQD